MRGKSGKTGARDHPIVFPTPAVRKERGMRHTLLVFSVVATAMLLAISGVALAATNSVPDAGTVQTDGQVSAIVVSGGKVYLGGFFTHVDGVARNHLAAVDAATGQLTPWDPNANDAVRALAISPDGTRVYAGGPFTSVGGTAHTRLAAIDAISGAVDPKWTPRADEAVRAIAVSGNRVYVGGRFSKVNGQSRTRLALLDATTGALDPSWAPAPNDLVRTLGLSSDGSRIYAGGDFTTVSSISRPYLAALDPATGASYGPWTQPTTPNGPVLDLQESAGRLYSAEGGPGGALTAYDPSTGSSLWRKTADGDVQAIAVLGGEVYVGGHFLSFSGNSREMFAAVDAATGSTDKSWAPNAYGANCSSAWTPDPCSDFVWAMEADPSMGRLYAGGDFRKVSGTPHAGFAQFSQQ
jgi:outer membrane protein assembly factor BamB